MAAPAFVGANSVGLNNASSLTVNRPAGVAEGDQLLFFIFQDNSKRTLTPPAGLTLLQASSFDLRPQYWIYAKTATAAEPTSYTFTSSGSADISGVVVAYTNAVVDVQGSTYYATNVSTMTTPSLTAANANNRIVSYTAMSLDGTISTPAGTTSRAAYQSDQNASFRLVDEEQVAAGATTQRTFSYSTAGKGTAAAVVLYPGNQPPNAPTLLLPADAASLPVNVDTDFTYTHNDAENDPQISRVFARKRRV